ncbi:MAG: polar amino acid transport system substrate-binding protein [Glaciecola sp.]|jgi:polar amino acid transport system substrate-binding protein
MKRTIKFIGTFISGAFFALVINTSFSFAHNSPNNINVTDSEKVIVYVDTFAPYINDKGAELGTSAKTLKILGEYADIDIEFRYVPYTDATVLMQLKKDAISFPYFITEARKEQFYFSKPIVNISIRLFFNRQYTELSQIKELNKLRVGTVVGYSYGENIDSLLGEAKEFESDMAALLALMKGEIDVLPMASGVMESLLNTYFLDQRQLIRPIQSIQDTEQFHVIAPKTAFGKKVIDKLNKAIELKYGNATPQDNRTVKAPDADVAELIPAEGFPAIIGQDLEDSDRNYTLPIGTKVVVLDWSEAIRNPNTNSNINRNMMLTSKVVILNGPHVGKELMVRNMHIKLN